MATKLPLVLSANADFQQLQTGDILGVNITGNSATTTNISGGAAGSLPYQTSANVTTFLAASTNGYVLTLSGGLPVWASSTGGVTSFSAGTTGFTPSTTTTGAIILAGTLNVANGGTGATTSTGTGSVVLSTNATLVTPNIGAATGTSINLSGTATATTFIGALTGHASADLALTGGTLSGALNMGGNLINAVATPISGTDAANKAYVDAIASNLAIHDEVAVATTAALTATYVNGASGVGATLTNSGAQAALVIDGVALVVGNRALVKNQVTNTQNGVYIVTNIGSVSTNWILTRASDADNSKAGELSSGYFSFVQQGTLNASSGWQLNSIGTGTNDAITIGTDAVTFVQFSGAGTYLAGTGILLTGNTFSNTGVLAISGTANQITTTGSTGAITLSLPQNINTGAAPNFAGTNFSVIPNSALSNSSVTVGTTSIALGASATTIAGLTSVTSTTFVGALTGNATTATTATNVAGGVAGAIHYQSAVGTTGFSAAGTSGQILLSGGTASPTWINQNGITLSSAQITTALGYTPENVANKGVANGYASLNGSGQVPASQLPAVTASTQLITTGTNNTGTTMAIGVVVYSDSSGTFQLANGAAVATSLVVGLNTASVVSGGTATIATEGQITLTTGQWDAIAGTSGGLVYGTNYYVSSTTPGNLTSTLPTSGYVTRLGAATSTTTLIIRIGDRVQL